jgi:hypothetical protein
MAQANEERKKIIKNNPFVYNYNDEFTTTAITTSKENCFLMHRCPR